MYETRVLGKHCPAKVSPKADRFSIQTGVQIEIDPATITDDGVPSIGDLGEALRVVRVFILYCSRERKEGGIGASAHACCQCE